MITEKEFQENISYLEEDTDMRYLGTAWENKPFSAELELYTDAGAI